jgi:hypothetical protein
MYLETAQQISLELDILFISVQYKTYFTGKRLQFYISFFENE